MLTVNQHTGFGAGASGDASLLGIIQSLGLSANLRLSLDAGALATYGGSGQVFADQTSGGYDFNLGATSGSEASDPTFNGSAGGLSASEYLSFDGGDFLRYGSANAIWMNNLHKNNAQFWCIGAFYIASLSEQGLFGTGIGGTDVGCGLRLGSTGKPEFYVVKGGGGNALTSLADTAVNNNAWNIVGLSIDETGNGFHYLNGAYNQVSSSDTFSAVYSSPSASNATYTLEVGAWGNGSQPLPNNSRLGMFAIGEGGTLSKANFDALWGEIRGRYSL